MATETSRRNLPTLTGLRWFAALAVFGYHSVVLLGGTAESGMRTLFDHGRVGVSFFFVLSGFIVTWAWRQDDGAWPFLRRRLARIYPAYLVALIAAVVLLKLTATDQSPKALLADLFLVQSWVPQRSVFFSGNDVGWSLSCEAFFYAAFPLLLVGLRRLTNTARRVLQVAIVTGIVIIAVWAAVFMPDDYFGVGGPAVFVAYIFPSVRALEFVLGMTIALDVRAGRRAPLRWRAAVMLTVVALAVNRVVPQGLDFAAVTVVPFALLIWAGALRDLDGQGTVMSNRWLVMLGEWSFCFYLVHRIVLLTILQLREPMGGAEGLAAVVSALLAGLLLAWALHSWVEKPAYKALRGSSRVGLPVSMRDEKAPI